MPAPTRDALGIEVVAMAILKPPYNYCKEKTKYHILELQIKFGFGVKFQFWGVIGPELVGSFTQWRS